jgi:hypothetical protein
MRPDRTAVQSAVADDIDDYLDIDVVETINGSGDLTTRRRSERLTARTIGKANQATADV